MTAEEYLSSVLEKSRMLEERHQLLREGKNRCITCGEIKPVKQFFWQKSLRGPKKGKKSLNNKCLKCLREARQKSARKKILLLAPSYIKQKIARSTGLKFRFITDELVVAYRKQMMISKKIKEIEEALHDD